MYMHKDIKTWHTKSLLISNETVPMNFIQELDFICNNYITPSHSFDSYALSYDYPESNFIFGEIPKTVFFDINMDELKGIKLKDNIINQGLLVNLLQYYLILNNYHIYNDNIYLKIKESNISYKLVGQITEVLYDKFQENVVVFFLRYFSGLFEGFDFNYILKTFFIKSKSIIESLKDISTNKIQPDFSLMEFSDGIYSITYNTFIPNKDFNKYNISNKFTIKYYDKSYNWIRKNKPENWLKGLQNALNIQNIKDLESNEQFLYIIKSISSIFQKERFKQSTLFIHGQSNTGKTTLMVKPLENYFGRDNIGSIISAKNFKWQDLIGKIIAIIDEGRYNQSMSSDLLKITGQENIIVEKKYSKNHIEIEPLPLFILSNILFKDNNEEINEALYNRMLIIEFINILSKEHLNDSDIFKINIKDEEANIIIYCNKLLFKIFKEKKKYKNINKILGINKIEKLINKS